MALENFANKIVGIEDTEEIRERLSEIDLNVLRTRDDRGNSLLHLVVDNDCSPNVFQAVLQISDLSVRNSDFKLAQDLFQDKTFEKEYVDQINSFIADKLRNADGTYIRDLVYGGWDHVPYLKCAIDNLVDIMSDNFYDTLIMIEELIDHVKMLTYEMINSHCDDLNLTERFDLGLVSGMRNHYGLTLMHIAVIFEKFDLARTILKKYSDIQFCFSDHMGRNILHYLYAMGESESRNQLIGDISTNECFNVVDILGNVPQFYEYSPDMLQLEACKEWVKAELLDVKNNIVENTVNNDSENTYLKKSVGKMLINALALIVEKRPVDPIEFLGCYLKFCADGVDHDKYEFESLSSSIMSKLCPEMVGKSMTFNAEIFSPFSKIARDKNGTPIGYKILIKKLKSIETSEIDWFEIMKRGMNFALRDSRGSTFIDIALENDYLDIKEYLDAIILNMINENNFNALKNLFSLGFFEYFPDIFDLCGPDLFDVSKEMSDFYIGLGEVNDKVTDLFSKTNSEEKTEEVNWCEVIDSEMIAYVYNKSGVALIHFSIVSNNFLLFKYLLENFPLSLRLKDCFNRNVSHYAVAYEREELISLIDESFPDAKTELDCFDYLPEYYEFYKNEFRRLV